MGAELARLVGLTVGFFIGFRYYQGVGDVVARNSFLGVEWAAAVAMMGLVLAGYLAVLLLLRFVGKVVQVTFQPKIGQAGGLLVGLLRGVLVSSVILVVCQQLPSSYLQASIQEHSLTGRTVSRMAPAAYDFISAVPGQVVRVLQPK